MGDTQPALFAELEKEQKKLKEKEEAKARREWKMDSSSFARLEITPVLKDGEIDHYDLNEAVEVKPYPNPIMMGGSWGGGGCKTKEEAEKAAARFRKKLACWDILDESYLFKHGMTQAMVSVVWNEPMLRAELHNLRLGELQQGDTQQVLSLE